MPLTLEIPERELFNETDNSFIKIPKTVLTLEHSLLSVSRWESKWKKPYLPQPVLIPEANMKTVEQENDYIRCMTIGDKKVDPNVYKALTNEDRQKVSEYINDPMTATIVSQPKGKPPSREIVTSELIYYWMVAHNIPSEYEKWHLNRLLTLIQVCNSYNKPPEKMSKNDLIRSNDAINAARRAAMRTRG
jgi:hypothetical protein